MSRGIAYVTGDGDLPPDLQTLDGEEEFAVTLVRGTGGQLGRPLPDATECIVVDHDPPTVDGLAVTAWLRDRYPSLPVVLYPSRHSESLAATAVNVEIDAYVPVREGRSVDLLRTQLRRLTARPPPARSRSNDDSGPASNGEPDRDDGAARNGTSTSELPEPMPMFDALLTSLPRWVSIYVKDRLGRHVAVSGSESAFTEGARITTPDRQQLHSREDLLGKTDFDLYPAELAEETRPQEQRVMRTEEPMVNVTETVEDPLGNTLYNSTTKTPWYDEDGNVAGIVGITVDITDRVERKHALERQNERLDRFAGVLSHDLRNPLTLASGQVELLRDHDLPDEAAESLDELDWALDRIETLIDDTLALAREGTAVTDPEPVDLAAVAESAWRASGDDRGTLAIEDGCPTIEGDADRVQRLFENLLANALDHGSPDDRREPLTITIGSNEDGFFVDDDGVGIPEAERENVFEHGYTTNETGTGFGLVIVEEIAAAHDWDVSVTDSSDGGARFEFRGVETAEASSQ